MKRRTVLLLMLPFALANGSCVRTWSTYRDVGADAISLVDAGARVDAARADAARMDAGPRPDAFVERMDANVDTGPVLTGADATRQVLASVGENVVLPAVRRFEADVTALVSALDAHRAGPTSATLAAARDAWSAAMATWERLEMLQVGPAALPGTAIGALGYRDEIYAWPLVSRCRIDTATTTDAYHDGAMLGMQPVSARGLGAIEYLLFYDATDHGCSASSTIVTSGAWAALGDAEVARRRTEYAYTAAVLVQQRATALRDAWEPSGGDFLGSFATAGSGSALFPSAQAGLNALSDALIYLYKDVTDNKIGIPAGVREECTRDVCPDLVESVWAHVSIEHARVNVEAFRDAYLGAPPTERPDARGIDDLVRAMGADTLDAQIQQSIADVLAAIDAVDGPLEATLVSDRASVVAVFDALRVLGNHLKVDLVTLLDLELPSRLAGDMD